MHWKKMIPEQVLFSVDRMNHQKSKNISAVIENFAVID